MRRPPFSAAAIGILAGFLLSSCAKVTDDTSASSDTKPIPPLTDAHPEMLESLDSFYLEMAERVVKEMGGETDFVVTKSPGAWSVGTVLRQDRSVPVTFSACRPADADEEVRTAAAPTLFPAYEMSRDVSASIGLDEAVFQGVAAANASASHTTKVGLSVGDPQLRMWSDIGMSKMLATDACRTALVPNTPYRVVRGLIIGQRKFTFKADAAGKVGAKAQKVASFEIALAGDGSTVLVTDEKPQGFLAIVSEFTMSPTPDTGPAVSTPTVAPDATGGSIFVQQDKSADPAIARDLIKGLAAVELPVVDSIERLSSDKLPSTAEVRYFRAGDKGKAETALDVMKVSYPDAKLVEVNIPAPSGQLEVWLPPAVRSATEPACVFVSIRALGWRSGHKTNFCRANGYTQGNYNQGDYKDGGICIVGPEPNVCITQFQGKLDRRYRCVPEGNRTVCYRR